MTFVGKFLVFAKTFFVFVSIFVKNFTAFHFEKNCTVFYLQNEFYCIFLNNITLKYQIVELFRIIPNISNERYWNLKFMMCVLPIQSYIKDFMGKGFFLQKGILLLTIFINLRQKYPGICTFQTSIIMFKYLVASIYNLQ